MKKFRILLLSLVVAFLPLQSMATHLLGGEITWECIKSGPNAGKFIFKMLLYRDCGTGTATIGTGNQTLQVHNNPNLSSITMYYQYKADISPGVNGNCNPNIMCNQVGSGMGAVEEYYFESLPITLTGTPPPNGWVFTWTSCCRPGTITNISSAGSQGYTLRAIMYPYNNQNVNPCFDSSPKFAEKPRTIICPGYLFQYNHNATDPELDSLRYEWAPAYGQLGIGGWNPPSNPSIVPYVAPYSFNNPSPGNPTINPNTGEIVINNTTTIGSFATCVKVTAYKCGIKVAEIFRDIPIIYGNCSGGGNNNNPPTVYINAQPLTIGATIIDTVEVGDFISFNLSSLDFDLNNGTTPQINCVQPSGIQLGAGLTNPNSGCLNPPCAYFSGGVNNGKICAPTGFNTTFNWQITCNHLGFNQLCFQQNNVYTFVFKVTDDNCPIQGLNFYTYKVVIKSPPAIPSPVIRCANVLPDGSVELTWKNPPFPTYKDSNSFYGYVIYTSNSLAGPYIVVDTVFNLGQNSYIHTGANANTAPKYYFIRTRSSCNKYEAPAADTVSTIYLNVTAINSGGTADLNWNHFDFPIPSTTTGWYYIWEKAPNGNWIIIDSVATNAYQKPITICNDSMYYKIELRDSIGCSSFSNVDGDLFFNNNQPLAVILDSVSVNGNNIEIAWQPSPTTSVTQYLIYQYSPPNTYNLIATTNGYNNTNYTYTAGNPNNQSYSFVVVPVDSCSNIGDTSLVHNTIYLQLVKTDTCNWTNEIAWNTYINWPGGVAGYLVWLSVNNAPYTLLTTTTSTNYIHTGLSNGNLYCYKIQAINSNGTLTSSSNELCVNVNNLKPNTVIDAPSLRCISVLPNGQIQLDWVTPPNPDNTFNSYHIYYSTNLNGPYAVIDSIFNYTTTSYTHANVNGNVGTHYYFINSRSGCTGFTFAQVTSDTLRSMNLNATVTGGTNVNLLWNSIHNPKLPTTAGQYDIKLEIPLNTGFNVIGNSPYGTESYADVRNYCNQNGIYYVEISDASGCVSRSSQDTVLFIDFTPPPFQYLDSVSVNPATGLAHMGWDKNPASDCYGYYIIQPLGGGSFQIIDTIWDCNITYYQYMLSQASNQPEYYTIAAFDSCGNYVNNQFDIHRTIHLKNTIDQCAGTVTLEWNKYKGFNNIQYQVWLSINGGTPTLLTTTSDSIFVHVSTQNNAIHSYWVTATGNNHNASATSMSNILSFEVEFVVKPQFLYSYYVTVLDSFETELKAFVDTAADVSNYMIYRTTKEQPTAFTPIAQIPASNDTFITYFDQDVLANQYSYIYKITAIDICGNEVMTSNLAQSILLRAWPDPQQFEVSLNWNKYKEWDAGVMEYQLYRIYDNNNPELIATFGPADTTFIDDISQIKNGKGRLCYLIKAKENSPTFKNATGAESVSNFACIQLNPVLWIPNAFVPESRFNPVFKPILVFDNVNEYTFRIFNRWGEMIYETNDTQAGWDGKTPGGVDAPMGVYVWSIYFKTKEGEIIDQRGTVNLIR